MAIFLDSVDVGEAREASDLGFVAGITTNPSLIAAARRPAYDVIRDLAGASSGIVFHQVAAGNLGQMEAEAERFLAIMPGRIALKVPCTFDGARLVHRLHERVVCAVTAVYAPAQAYLFSEAGARYVIPYFNRAARQGIDPLELVVRLSAVVAAWGVSCEVLAASLKTTEEVAAAVGAGARHVTVPWSLLRALADHPLTGQALADFAAAAAPQ